MSIHAEPLPTSQELARDLDELLLDHFEGGGYKPPGAVAAHPVGANRIQVAWAAPAKSMTLTRQQAVALIEFLRITNPRRA